MPPRAITGQPGTYNAANDWYFADFGISEIGDSDSTQFIKDVIKAGSNPLMTMVMLPWVAKDVTDGSAYSFSVAKYGAQCGVNPYNSDDGDGMKTDCSTAITGNDPNDADVPTEGLATAGRSAGHCLSQPVDGGAGRGVRQRSSFL